VWAGKATTRRPVYPDTLVTEPAHSLLARSLKANEAKIETNGDGFGVAEWQSVLGAFA